MLTSDSYINYYFTVGSTTDSQPPLNDEVNGGGTIESEVSRLISPTPISTSESEDCDASGTVHMGSGSSTVSRYSPLLTSPTHLKMYSNCVSAGSEDLIIPGLKRPPKVYQLQQPQEKWHSLHLDRRTRRRRRSEASSASTTSAQDHHQQQPHVHHGKYNKYNSGKRRMGGSGTKKRGTAAYRRNSDETQQSNDVT